MGLSSSVVNKKEWVGKKEGWEENEYVNEVQELINSCMKIKFINNMFFKDKQIINTTLEKLMGCTSHKQVVDDYLKKCLVEHAEKWSKLNNIELNVDEYVDKHYHHLHIFMNNVYYLEVLSRN